MGDSDLIQEFLIESYENLDRMDRDLVALEKDPTNKETLASIFRTIHTIKGTCGFLGFSKLESVTHVGENLLSKLRDGALKLTAARTSGMLKMVDAVREILGEVEKTEKEGDGDYSALVVYLGELIGAAGEDGAATVPAAAVADVAASPVVATPVVSDAGTGEAIVAEVVGGAPAADEGAEVAGKAAGTGVADTTIRVEVALLDRLMTLVGELVLARNQVLQSTAGAEDAALAGTKQRLNLVTSELQESVMKTRMQPISKIWSKLPRVVRDLSGSCGKRVRLELEGQETELDKTILEAIKDPLTHVVRNSIDHGIEKAEDRVAAGKEAEGTLRMRAFHAGGQVNIEIIDDGRGVNVARVKAKAVENGLITAEAAAKMSDCEAVGLIFAPGFSTAEKITNVSGRGVGMDVVKTNIEAIGGQVDMESVSGKGTTLKIKIPLTLAIIPALLVSSGGERFAIPQVNLTELVRVERRPGAGGIEMLYGSPVYRLRGNLLPLVHLNEQLGLKGLDEELGGDTGGSANIVVLQADGRAFGLVVDAICETEEIVVKPLGGLLKSIPAFAGVTVLGDGRVSLILDVMGLAQKARVLDRQKAVTQETKVEESAVGEGGSLTLLLVEVGAGLRTRRLAVPLAKVARLEEFAVDKIETAGGREVMQYRDGILPIVRLGQLVGADKGGQSLADESTAGQTVNVVVYQVTGRQVGLVVEQILDIVEWTPPEDTTGKSSLQTQAVVGGRVVELLDVEAMLGQESRAGCGSEEVVEVCEVDAIAEEVAV
jgi:two-component system chemotaxis sensor kinase CheA